MEISVPVTDEGGFGATGPETAVKQADLVSSHRETNRKQSYHFHLRPDRKTSGNLYIETSLNHNLQTLARISRLYAPQVSMAKMKTRTPSLKCTYLLRLSFVVVSLQLSLRRRG